MPARSMERCHEAVKTHPKTGHFETHHGAVEWHILSPKGEDFKFKNLVLWIDEHEELLPVSKRTGNRVDKKTFYREIMRLKSDNEKYTYFRNDYHGWKVIKKIIKVVDQSDT